MSSAVTEFEFLRPAWLLLIPLAAALLVLLHRNRTGGGWQRYLSAEKIAALTPARSDIKTPSAETQPAEQQKQTLQPYGAQEAGKTVRRDSGWHIRSAQVPWIVLIASCIALLALAGPSWKATPNPLASQRQALVILFDLSPSMLAQDIKPNRLTRARLKVIDLLRARTEGETALVVYAGDAHRIAPLSDDPATVETLVHTLHPEIMPVPGSQIESAVTLSLDLFAGAELERGDILLVTDGVHPQAVQQLVNTLPAAFRVSILGVGTEAGAAIPVKPNGYLLDKAGNTHIARLEEASLQGLANNFAGRYERISDDSSDINSLLDLVSKPHDYDLFDSNLTTSDAEFDSRHDSGYWLVLLLLPLAALLFRRAVLWTLVLWICLPALLLQPLLWPSRVEASDGVVSWQAKWSSGFQALWLNKNQRALRSLREGDAETAAKLFTDPVWRAIAVYRQGDYAEAARQMQQSMQSDENNTAGKISAGTKRYVTDDDFFNLANALALAGEYEASLQAYDYALALYPDNTDARHNRSIVLPLVPQQQDEDADEENSGTGNSDDSRQEGESADSNASSQQEAASGAHQQSGAAMGSGQSLDQSAIIGNSVDTDQPGESELLIDEQAREIANTGELQTPVDMPSAEQPAGDSSESADGLIPGKGNSNVLNPYSEQWLQNLVEDPGGYLRRKLQHQAQVRIKQNNGEPPAIDPERY